PLALGCAQCRAAAEDDHQLLGAMVVVVGGRVARPELIHAGAEIRPGPDEPARLGAAAGPVVELLPVVAEDVHAACCRSRSSSSPASRPVVGPRASGARAGAPRARAPTAAPVVPRSW